MAPWFSVVIPVYNVMTYLQRSVRSIVTQSFQDLEVILVNDGSTDGTGELCDQLAQEYLCIRVIHKENGGSSSARNVGLEAAKGQYIWFVDSDDAIEPDSLQCLYQVTAEQKPEIVKFDYCRMEGPQIIPVKGCSELGMYGGERTEILLRQACCSVKKYELSVWSHIYSREFLCKHGLKFASERVIGSEDFLLNLQAYPMAQSICVIGENLYRYEVRMGSLSQKFQKNLAEKYTKLYENLYAYYEQKGLLSRFGGWISAFYLWHLLRGCCIPNAYSQSDMAEGRKIVRTFLAMKELKQAYQIYDRKAFSLKQRVLLLAMKLRLEPLFYRLYVVNPGKKGSRNEDQA